MDDGSPLAGRYALRAPLGSGATATVYRAEDLALGRTVAIKVFGAPSEVSDAERRRDEARVLATLRHPAIVTLFDAHLDHDPPFLVLEYVPGPTLADVLREGALPRERARLLGAATAAGLARAHDAGVVHRDVKPANIVLPEDRRDGAARLVDFGIADSPAATARVDGGSVLGSASYLSPEQAIGDPVGPASDVYSLGLVLVETLLGRPAFPGSSPAAIAVRLFEGPPLDDPEVAQDAGLLARMTAREPADRPSAAEVAAILGARATRPEEPPLPAATADAGAPTAQHVLTPRLGRG